MEQFSFNVSKFNHICRPKPNTIYVPQSYIWGFQVGICMTMVHNVGFWALGSCCSSEGVRFHKDHTLLISLGLIHVNAISIDPVWFGEYTCKFWGRMRYKEESSLRYMRFSLLAPSFMRVAQILYLLLGISSLNYFAKIKIKKWYRKKKNGRSHTNS